MKTVLFALSAFAAAAVAADSDCAADYIVTACLESEEAKLSSCGTNDWDCKCNGHINVITCFNNCPNDTRKGSWEGQKQIFCEYASVYPSTTTTLAGKTTAATAPAKTTAGKNEEATDTVKEGSSGTATGSAAAATKTDNAAVDLVYNTGSMLAAVAAVVAAVL